MVHLDVGILTIDTLVVTIGLAISVPLILIAFNVDRIAVFLGVIRAVLVDMLQARSISLSKPILIATVLGVFAAIFTPIWTSSLASAAKVAATVIFIVLTVLGVIGVGIRALVYSARRTLDITETSSSGS